MEMVGGGGCRGVTSDLHVWSGVLSDSVLLHVWSDVLSGSVFCTCGQMYSVTQCFARVVRCTQWLSVLHVCSGILSVLHGWSGVLGDSMFCTCGQVYSVIQCVACVGQVYSVTVFCMYGQVYSVTLCYTQCSHVYSVNQYFARVARCTQ